jgi:hypothetical protein
MLNNLFFFSSTIVVIFALVIFLIGTDFSILNMAVGSTPATRNHDIPPLEIERVRCPDGSTVSGIDKCPPTECPDGSTVPAGEECPTPIDYITIIIIIIIIAAVGAIVAFIMLRKRSKEGPTFHEPPH